MKDKNSELEAIRNSGIFTEAEIKNLIAEGAFDKNADESNIPASVLSGLGHFAELMEGDDQEIKDALAGYIQACRDDT